MLTFGFSYGVDSKTTTHDKNDVDVLLVAKIVRIESAMEKP
jgi:hypothetical protein